MNAPDLGRSAAAAAAAELMVLHAKAGTGGVNEERLDRGRRRAFDPRDQQTHERTILHAAEAGGCNDAADAERWKTSPMASQDARELKRATRRLARRKMRDAS